MSETLKKNENSLSNSSLYEILRNCAQTQSYESLENSILVDYNDVWGVPCYDYGYDYDYNTMLSANSYSTHSGGGTSNMSSSCSSDESFADNILEENGRISLAYENLRTIPRKIANKFAAQTKFLDLSFNNFQNLSFLTFFEDLHTLILDRNTQLDPSSFPFLFNLEILWLNNCNISKITDWIEKIQRQCPALRQLSIMGNPGTKDLFNCFSLHRDGFPHELQTITTTTAMNCRDYILDMLPTLEYLDGLPRFKKSTENLMNGKNFHFMQSSTNNSAFNGSSVSDKDHNGGRNGAQTSSPTLSFKDLFQLKRRKRSFQSSSTN